ncbi:MAG: hypothetical protein V4640_14695 [Verrucomicrobiota bacterium]
MAIAAFFTLTTKRTWTRFSLIASTLFLVGWASAYAKYRSSATEAFRQSSPDGRYHLVVYRLPSFGAFQEGAAIVRLLDETGRQLHQGDIAFVGASDATWTDKEVIVGDHVWGLK